MTRYLIRKALLMILSLFAIISLTFVLMKSLPGDPFQEEQALPKEIHEALRKHYGLDQPILTQYLVYLKSIAKGDFGPSFKYKDRTVNDIIRENFPVSATLGLEAFFIALGLGVFLGALSALKAHHWQDTAILFFTIAAISVPSFILATALQYTFALKLDILPLARWESFSHTILPAIALAAMPTAFITRLMRSSMLEVLRCDYIKTAKAKGLPMQKIIAKHALRNAFLPVLTYLGQLLANILVGSFVIERIFSIPGLGDWFVHSVGNRDYTVIMGLTLFYSIILLTAILCVDIAYSFLDPRIRSCNKGRE